MYINFSHLLIRTYLHYLKPVETMIILIAESKTMLRDEAPVTEEEYITHRPYFEAEAESYMHSYSHLEVQEVSSMLKCSHSLAVKAIELAREFPLKSSGLRASEAFTGVVFDSFDYTSLSKESRSYADAHIMIASSLYGLLYLTDIIKPYRLDYNVTMPDEEKNMAALWKQKNTIRLVKLLKERGDTEIINLMPSAASKCFDWKVIKNFCKVRVPDFRTPSETGRFQLPHAGLLKRMRGHLLRELVEKRGQTIFNTL